MLRSLLYVASLSRKAVLIVLLAVLCCACGYGIVYPSSSLCGSIFVYYKRALHVYGCMHSLREQPYMGGPEKWQKRGRAKRVLSHFCRLIKIVMVILE